MNLSHLVRKNKVVQKKDHAANLKTKGGPWNSTLKFLQELGKSLQYPIAILPFAAILNRFGALGIGYSSMTDTDGVLHITNQAGYWISYIIQTPGAVVFNNLALIFAVGVAFGLAKDHRGEVALIGGVFYLILAAFTANGGLPSMMYGHLLTFHAADGKDYSQLLFVEIMGKDGTTIDSGKYVLDIGVLGGITAGTLSAYLYNRYKEIKLPQALSFFGGRRFVPMIALICSIPVAFVFAVIWPWIQFGLMKFGESVADPNNPAVAIPGTAVYAVLNRLLLPFGLHQILNTFFWFQLPIHGPVVNPGSGLVPDPTPLWVNGDINAFTKGIEGSGLFQSGFFPIMMGGIPAIALAMIYCAKKENRVQIAGFLGGVALVSFISGITEPIEFSFVFVSPLLLGVHSLLTGAFMAVTTAMHIQIGFGFSAGLIDYCVSMAQSWGFYNHNTGITHITSNPLWVLLLIVLAGTIYFFVFSTLIEKMNIKTPGREDEGTEAAFMTFDTGTKDSAQASAPIIDKKAKKQLTKTDKYNIMAEKIIIAVGADNFVSVDNCATRLRLIVKDASKINQAQVKAAGAFGIKILTNEAVQIVIGPDVEHVTNAVKKQLNIAS